LRAYLKSTDFIDWQHPRVRARAKNLAEGHEMTIDIARACYVWVRDKIPHTGDHGMSIVTCRASEAIIAQTGFSFSKSHLLAALLRANYIPAGLCYQRIRDSHSESGFSLHCFNAVFLPKVGWYRIDARGNNDYIDAGFNPPKEQLAYPALQEGEADLPKIWADPLFLVIDVLRNRDTVEDLLSHPPDIEIIAIPNKNSEPT
jgi:transglutaminase-like putative cysteine protease